MYLVLELTNGDGYSSPTFEVFSNRKKAVEKFDSLCFDLLESGATPTKFEKDKKLFLSEDGEDNIAVHLIGLDDYQSHVVSIQTCYVDEIEIDSFDFSENAEEHYKREASEIDDYNEAEDNENKDGSRSASGDTDDGSKFVLLIFNKK